MKKKVGNSNIPLLKKKVKAFLVGEEGKISKKSLLKIGGTLTGLSSLALIGATTVDEVHLGYSGVKATATHENHSSHASHASHSSY